MENYKKKLIVSLLILLFVICGCAGIGFFVQSIFSIGNEYDAETNELIASIERTCDTLSENNYTSLESYSERILENVNITAILVGEQETEEEDDILGPFDRGFVVRLDHGQLVTNGTLPFNVDSLAAEIATNSESGTFQTNYTDAENKDAQHRVAEEASYLYAPLAHKLGLYKLKSELEDLSLKYLEHDAYYHIKEKLSATKRARDKYIEDFIGPVRQRLEAAGS